MHSWTVYKITNNVDGKGYIGITNRELAVRWRWRVHCKKSSKCHYMRNAIQKHGKDAFTVAALDIASSLEEAHAREIQLIAEYKSDQKDFGYNLTSGGEGYLRRYCKYGHDTHILGRDSNSRYCVACRQGRKRSPEEKERIRNRRLNRRANEPGFTEKERSAGRAKQNAWWDSLTPAEKKEHNRTNYLRTKDKQKAKRDAKNAAMSPEEKAAKSAVQTIKSKEYRERLRVLSPEKFETLQEKNRVRCREWHDNKKRTKST